MKATAKVGPNQIPWMPKSVLKAQQQESGIPQSQYDVEVANAAIPCFPQAFTTEAETDYVVSKNMKTRRTGHARAS